MPQINKLKQYKLVKICFDIIYVYQIILVDKHSMINLLSSTVIDFIYLK